MPGSGSAPPGHLGAGGAARISGAKGHHYSLPCKSQAIPLEDPQFEPRYPLPLKIHLGPWLGGARFQRCDQAAPFCPGGKKLFPHFSRQGVGADQPGLPSKGSHKYGESGLMEWVAGLTMWWLLFPHQGLSSSSWWASWAQRTANTLSVMQNTSEMPQRHRLELWGGGAQGAG